MTSTSRDAYFLLGAVILLVKAQYFFSEVYAAPIDPEYGEILSPMTL